MASSHSLHIPLTLEEENSLDDGGWVPESDEFLWLLEHPFEFIDVFFKHRLKKLEPFHKDLVEVSLTERRGLELFPATHGKTTLISMACPIFATCRDPNARISITAKNAAEAGNIAQSIRRELEQNTDLIRAYGPFKPRDDSKPWRNDFFQVDRRTSRAKEHTMAFFGSRSWTALGYRTDWSICDDVVTDKNSATEDQREKLKEWFSEVILTMPEEDNDRITVCGTRFHPDDLYGDLVEMSENEDFADEAFRIDHKDAIVSEADEETLWPERWPWKRLMAQKRLQGTLAFNKRYRNMPVDPERQVFKEEFFVGGWLGREKHNPILDPEYTIGGAPRDWPHYGGHDIGSLVGWSVSIALAHGKCDKHESCIWVQDLNRDQMSFPTQAHSICDIYTEYDMLELRSEANGIQEGIGDMAMQEAERRGLAINVSPHVSSKENKPDPEIGVTAMLPWFEQARVHIPYATATDRRVMDILKDEFITHPGKTTDCVMAFWFAWLGLRAGTVGRGSYNRLKKPVAIRSAGFNRRRIVRNPFYAR